MCEKEVEKWPWSLEYVPDNLKTQEMCKKAMRSRVATFFFFVPDCFKIKKMCKKVVEAVPSWLEPVPDNFKTQGMCNKVVQKRLCLLEYVPDWFVTKEQIGMMKFIIAIMIGLLSGTRVIKNARPRKHKLKKS